jgi:hypothetical protein
MPIRWKTHEPSREDRDHAYRVFSLGKGCSGMDAP